MAFYHASGLGLQGVDTEDKGREDVEMDDGDSERDTNASYTNYDGASDVSYPSSSAHHPPPSTVPSASASYPGHSAGESNLSSFTSYEQNIEEHPSRSPSPSRSVMSITESIATRIYREEYGRILNDYSDVYRLPADDEEWERLGVFQFISICSIRRRLPI
jgi:hypothetical protein